MHLIKRSETICRKNIFFLAINSLNPYYNNKRQDTFFKIIKYLIKMKRITEYKNSTSFLVVVKQSNGSTYELNTGMSIKADVGTQFTAIKYPLIGKQWYKLHPERIRQYN